MLIDGIAGLDRSNAPVCIVGSGPVGLSLAISLARRGIRCLVLESGCDAADASIQELSAADRVEPARHDDMRIAVARRLGGTSNLWGGRCLPYDPVDFLPRPGVDAQWPIAYEDMAAWLPAAAEATGSGDAIYHAETPLADHADDAFLGDTLERWVNVQSSARVFRDEIAHNPLLEIRTNATVTGIAFAENGTVTAIDIAHSGSGEHISMPIGQLVLAAGGLETTRLLLAAAGPDSGRFCSGDGPLGRHYMGHVIGEIADVVFDDRQTAAKMDFYVDRHGSYVRRRFAANQATQLDEGLLNAAFWPVVPAVSNAQHRSAVLSLVYLALRNRRLGGQLVAEAIRQRHIPDPPPSALPHLANLATGLPGAASFALGFLRRRYLSHYRMPGFFIQNRARRYALAYHGEHLPNPLSRVWLANERDRLGLPRLVIDLRFDERDASSLVRTHALLDTWLRRNRIGRLDYAVPESERAHAILASAAHGTHQIGLARMAANRSRGVVDAGLRSFDAANLYLAGSAVLPTSGQANPTLTAVALALRLGEALARSAGK